MQTVGYFDVDARRIVQSIVEELLPRSCFIRALDSCQEPEVLASKVRSVLYPVRVLKDGVEGRPANRGWGGLTEILHGFDDVWFGTVPEFGGSLAGLPHLTSDALYTADSREALACAAGTMRSGVVGVGTGDFVTLVGVNQLPSTRSLVAGLRIQLPDSSP